MDENNQIQKEDEIGLIDLFAVLLRYRKLIICATIAAFIIAAAGYIFYPMYRYNKITEDGVILQGRMLVSINPMGRYLPQRMETFFFRSDIVLDSLREAGKDIFNNEISLIDPAERQKALYAIDQNFIRGNKNRFDDNSEGNIYRVIDFSPTGSKEVSDRDSNTFDITFRDTDPEFINSFLHSLYAVINENMADLFRPIAENRVSAIEQLLNDTSNSSSIIRDFQYIEYTFMKDFLEGNQNILIMNGEPIIMEPIIKEGNFRRSFRITAVIIVFAGFFLSVFAAFALNAINSIKNDEQAMEKIREAMGKKEG